ncbi:hypothetical protein [Streptomyces sp. MNP-20]|nr:hypothetical protein [Streptomyces sp. MNP-20]
MTINHRRRAGNRIRRAAGSTAAGLFVGAIQLGLMGLVVYMAMKTA